MGRPQGAQQGVQLTLLIRAEGAEEVALDPRRGLRQPPGGLPAGLGQREQPAPTIGRIDLPLHEPAAHQDPEDGAAS